MPKTVFPRFHIPTSEIKITFARSSGAGGQNVNKTSTKAILHWSIGDSRVLNIEQKKLARVKLANKINWFDEVVITSEEERSQPQNRALAIARLQTLVTQALRVPKKRRPTRPTYGSKLKRLETKKIHSRLKIARRTLD